MVKVIKTQHGYIMEKYLDTYKKIANELNINFSLFDLETTNMNYNNTFEINNSIYFYPLNDGLPTRAFEFYRGNKLIIDNRKEYSQLSNLDDIILQMVRVYRCALESNIILDPYYFMLELNDEIKPSYEGKANLIITEKAIVNPTLDEKLVDRARVYFINRFLDHFIGWNFGLSVNRNEELKEELNNLNDLVIDMGLRQAAGPGFEVYGTSHEVHNGLQHYYLPTEKENIKRK